MERISLKIILNITILGILVNGILPSVSFAWFPKEALGDFGGNVSFAQSNPQVSGPPLLGEARLPGGPPETLKEARNVGIKSLKIFPAVFKGLWQEALKVWQAMFRAIKSFLGKYIQSWLQSLWEKTKTSLFQEGERRKPIIEEEFKKEKTEMRKEAPDVGKSLWERFRELIK